MKAPTLTSNQQAALHRIQVRLILPTEWERWNTLMQAHHYRGFRTMAGRTLRYVTTLDDRWVALSSAGRPPLTSVRHGSNGSAGPGSCAASVCTSSPIMLAF